ncbi:MAG: tellurite resistance TerB family protein, partial [Desulfopila sp.]|nr:tellurite resistance TerB family protein [Desulfopila sp.]
MNSRSLIDQLLKSGGDLLQGGKSGNATAAKGQGSSQLGSLLAGAGGGALATGALSLLLGSKKSRKMGGKVLTYGGLAALGVLAYKAYGNWQQQNSSGSATLPEPQTVDKLPEKQAEEHSYAILRALIAAAKADGHIDNKERELIDAEIAKFTGDRSLQQWFDKELNSPLDPADVARSATTPEMAAEMYLASVLVVDEQ